MAAGRLAFAECDGFADLELTEAGFPFAFTVAVFEDVNFCAGLTGVFDAPLAGGLLGALGVGLGAECLGGGGAGSCFACFFPLDAAGAGAGFGGGTGLDLAGTAGACRGALAVGFGLGAGAALGAFVNAVQEMSTLGTFTFARSALPSRDANGWF